MADNGKRFAEYLARRVPQIEQRLALDSPTPQDLTHHAAMDLIAYLYEPYSRFVSSGGKRVRPALCLLGAEAVGADPVCALSTAIAIESFQTAALIHDDIADKSELRRGEPCMHLVDGTGIAINVGDMAIVNLYAELLTDGDMDDETCLRVLCEVTFMEQRTLEGQALDLGWVRDGRWDLSVDDYLFMATSKTAYYSAASPLACGAICGKGSEEQIEGLFNFGVNAGLAFQLQDDLLNLVGDAERQGKDFRSDITEGKRTMIALYALEHLEGAEREELQALLSSGTTDDAERAQAVGLMEQAGAIDAVRAKAHELVATAKEQLPEGLVDDAARETLLSMADFFVERAG